jgi:orotate phosphoribosyltransferase
MSLADDRARLLDLLRTLSFERRRVVLASGRESDFYIDCKRTALTAEGHALIGRVLLDRIRRLRPPVRAVGGLTLGADPLASAIALTSFLEVERWRAQGRPEEAGPSGATASPPTARRAAPASSERAGGSGGLSPPDSIDSFVVRKEPKGHGTGQWIEGRRTIPDGSRVAVLEDVVTTGGSALKAIERCRGEKLEVIGCFAVVDRMEGGREAIEAQGVPLEALFDRKDFLP